MVNQALVVMVGDEPRCSSLIIAETFGRRHRSVVETVEKLISSLEANKNIKTPMDWRLKFLKKTEVYRGRTYDVYWMTRDAFSLLIMRFITPEALAWQVKFNDAFYELEKQVLFQQLSSKDDKLWLAQRQRGKLLRRQETDAIKILVDYATEQGSKHAHFYYKNITSMTYRCLGFVKQAGSESLRDTLDVVQHIQLASAEIVASRAILKGVQDKRHYKEIYLLAEQAVMANIRSFMPEFDQQPKQLTEGK